jgi:serine/threonine protein kinase
MCVAVQVAAAQAANLPLDFAAPHWAGVSPTARTLVSLMLTRDPHQRPSAAQLLTSFSDWLQCDDLA